MASGLRRRPSPVPGRTPKAPATSKQRSRPLCGSFEASLCPATTPEVYEIGHSRVSFGGMGGVWKCGSQKDGTLNASAQEKGVLGVCEAGEPLKKPPSCVPTSRIPKLLPSGSSLIGDDNGDPQHLLSGQLGPGWMDGWLGGWMDGWVDEWMDGWEDGWEDGWMDGWMGGWVVDGWDDGRMGGWEDGRLGGWEDEVGLQPSLAGLVRKPGDGGWGLKDLG